MSTVYNDPIMLDSTGQDIVTKLDSIVSLMGDGVIDDTSTTATDKTWSASKENTVVNGLQDNIIANTKLIKDTVGWSGKNKFNYDAWKSVGINNGIAVFENNGVSLTATANNCYTRYELSDTYPTAAKIPVIEGETIKLLWKCTETTIKGGVLICPNGQGASAVSAYNNVGKLEYTPASGVDFVTIRFGVTTSGDTVHYKDIMVIDANILDSTYEPYFGSTAFPRSEQAVLGAKNLLPFAYELMNKTDNGVTATTDKNGVVNLDGTLSNYTFEMRLCGRARTDYVYKELEIGKTYIASLGVDLAENGLYLQIGTTKNNAYADIAHATVGTELRFTVTSDASDIAINGKIPVAFYIRCVIPGTTFDNLKVYPMLRLASDTDPTFVSPAMSNKELSDEIRYVAGDEINLSGAMFYGYITSAQTELWVNIPLMKPIRGAITLNITNFVIRGISGYIVPNDSALSSYKVTGIGVRPNGIEVTIKNADDSAFTEVNNTPLVGRINSGSATISQTYS